MEPLYDNGGGSALLFEARAGALRALVYRQRFEPTLDVQVTACRACGQHVKTTEHLVLHSRQLSPSPQEDTSIQQALGLATDSGRCTTATSVTKNRLQQWWKVTQFWTANQ